MLFFIFLKILFQVIADFITYLEEWGKERERDLLSTQTHRALLISLKAVLELVAFLSTVGYQYLMTKHVNQDPLEVKAVLKNVNSTSPFHKSKLKVEVSCPAYFMTQIKFVSRILLA